MPEHANAGSVYVEAWPSLATEYSYIVVSSTWYSLLPAWPPLSLFMAVSRDDLRPEHGIPLQLQPQLLTPR